jgi:hypothetical protein
MSTPIAHGQKSTSILENMRGTEHSVDSLVKDMRRDAYVKLAERDIRATVATAQVSVSTESTDPRALALAETLDELWRNHCTQMLECIPYGRAAFEIVWTYVPGLNLNTVLRLEPLPYEHTEPYFCDQDKASGRAGGVVLGGGDAPLELPRPYGWWLALDATALNPYGESLFVGAMEDVWRRRCDVLKKLETFVRKYALGDDVVYAPPTRLGPNNVEINAWDEIAEAYRQRDGGDLLILPADYEQDAAGGVHRKYEVDRSALGARDGSPLMNLSKELGSEVLLAACIPPRTVIEGDSGSFAMVTWQMLVKFAMIEDKLSQIGQQFQNEIVQPAEAFNGIGGIEWNYVPLTQRPDDLVVEIVKQLILQPALSPLITSGQVDVRQMLEMAGIPISEKSATLLQSVNPQAPVAQMSAPSFRYLLQ